MRFWVYVLRCADGSYYVGSTDRLAKRLAAHETGERGGYTSARRPVRLVFAQETASRQEALALERQIKGWSRKKKEAMMRRDWAALSRLAKARPRESNHVDP
jgi:predicted GIY-YIG superfamily endonuclease